MRKYIKILIFTLIFTSFFVWGGASNIFAQTTTLKAEYTSGPFQGETPSGGLEPLSDIILLSSLQEAACSSSRNIYYALRNETTDTWAKNGQAATFNHTFNSGTSGERHKYIGYYYCFIQDIVGAGLALSPNDISATVGPGSMWTTPRFNQTTVGGNCNLFNAKWGSSQGSVGSPIKMTVDGTLGCKGKEATFQIVPNVSRVIKEVKVNFPVEPSDSTTKPPTFTATANWTPSETGSYRFDAKVFGVAGSVGRFKAISPTITIIAGNGGGEGTPETLSITIPPPYGISDFTDLIDTILNWLIRIAIPIGIITLVVSGIFMISSQGNPNMVNKAKTIFKYAIIGIAIIFIGKGFITLLESILDLAG